MEKMYTTFQINSTLNETYGTPSCSVFYSLGALFLFITVFALMEHILIIVAFVTTQQLRTADNVLFMGLCGTDVALTCFSLPLVVISCFAKSWAFGPTWCIIYAYITTALGLTQITMLVAIAVERYREVVRFSRPLSISNASSLIFGCILYGFGWAVGPLLGWSSYKIESIKIACSVDWEMVTPVSLSYNISLLTFCWIIPLILICFGYGSITCKVIETRKRSLVSKRKRQRSKSRERKVAITGLWITGAFVFSWLPYSMIAFLSITSNTDPIPSWLWVASSALAKCSIIWNPIIYIARNRPFRSAAKNILTTLVHLQTSRMASQQRGGSGCTLEVLPQVDQETNMIEMD